MGIFFHLIFRAERRKLAISAIIRMETSFELISRRHDIPLNELPFVVHITRNQRSTKDEQFNWAWKRTINTKYEAVCSVFKVAVEVAGRAFKVIDAYRNVNCDALNINNKKKQKWVPRLQHDSSSESVKIAVRMWREFYALQCYRNILVEARNSCFRFFCCFFTFYLPINRAQWMEFGSEPHAIQHSIIKYNYPFGRLLLFHAAEIDSLLKSNEK